MTLEHGEETNPKEINVIEYWTLFSKVLTNWRKLLEREMENLSIKPIEFRLLKLLHDNGDTSMNSLADLAGVTSPWITATINKLSDRGLVTKTRSKNDRRMVWIGLTEKGSELISKGRGVLVSVIGEHLKMLSAHEISCINEALDIMIRAFR